MTSLLIFGITIGFILLIPVDSVKIIHVNTSQELENVLCNDSSLPVRDVIFELNSSNYSISNGARDFCILNKFLNITLQSNNLNPAVITCFQDNHHPHPTRGLSFINSTVTLRRVKIINCGTSL